MSYEIERKVVDNRSVKEQQRKAKAYNDLYNEGGEGFNPYR